ncbi:long flagella protein [Chrysochromulina tobinii]|uniref:Long flagella protein n=1 Tax=Chrysochromulina tobinii TaxID=1460289 RepID=A0A0M0JJX6_9EUKA|nr:long flagella protein [Chrysochromulina tobinii]|eukprot:KOO26533.1 long flagella protein [Chrysochromulina sp. CCMP291]
MLTSSACADRACRYRLIGKKGEGTFSEVLKAQGIKNGKYVAIKCMKNHFDSLDQVNNLREIQALRRLSPHPGVIKLCEVLYDQPTRRLALVFELMDMNIYELIRGRRQYLAETRIKIYMYQLLKSMDHMHRNGIFHRDIKPENILITDDELKLADFGSCRGIYSKQPYTEYISTRWYRAPECLLTDGFYNYKMDMWGVGCVFFEVLSLYPLFPGTNELDQVQKIHAILGTPPAETLAKLKKHSNSHIDFNFPHKEATPLARLIPHCSAECVDVIVKLLAYDPDDRMSARQAVKHPYFKDLRAAELKEKQAQAQAAAGSEDGISEERVGALKIDSKSLMGSSKTQTQKAREQYRMSKQVPKKPTGLIAGAIAKAGSLSDGPSGLAIGQLGVGLASQNASQSQIDAELSIKSVAKAVSHKTYQSPYSQKPRK